MTSTEFNADERVKNSKVLERVVTSDMLPKSAKVFRDDNPIHLDVGYAKANGFDDTPVHGAFIQSYFDLCAMQNGMMLTGSRFDMKRPVYPGTKMNFRLTGFEKGDDRQPDYRQPQFVCETDKGVVARLKGMPVESANLREPVEIKPDWALVGSYSYTISEDDVNDFYQLIGVPFIEAKKEDLSQGLPVPRALLFSLVPSSLLNLARGEDGKPVGTFKKMYPTFHREAHTGEFQVDVHLKNTRESRDGYAYTFVAVCRTNGLSGVEQQIFGDSKVVASGKASVASPVKVEVPEPEEKEITSQAAS